MAVTPGETARALREACAREQRVADERAARARRSAEEVAAVLVRRFGATAVYLHGSLARGTHHARSDIDIAVAGIPRERLDEAREVADAMSPIPVELLPIEALNERWRRSIERDGLRLS